MKKRCRSIPAAMVTLVLFSMSAWAQTAKELKTKSGSSVALVNFVSAQTDCSSIPGPITVPVVRDKPTNGIVQMVIVVEAERQMAWSTPFDDWIDLPDGRKLITLKDAATYITELPEDERQRHEWQKAARSLIGAAEHPGGVDQRVQQLLKPSALGGIVEDGSCDECAIHIAVGSDDARSPPLL